MGACVFTIVIPSFKMGLLLLYNVLLYLFWEFLTFKSILSDLGMATCVLLLPFVWIIVFKSFTFSLCVSLNLK